jgi:NAD(P)-dependent dehydrogenase (short-subunit alcohol dehydrogenase family)
MTTDVQDKVVLITGANRGIGRAILESAIQRGAKKVYAAIRQLDRASVLVDELGDRVVPVLVDMRDSQTIRELAATATDVEVLINNAGVLTTAGPLSDAAVESLQYEFDTNVFGLIHLAQAFAPVLKANDGGVLVQVNSVVSMRAYAGFATYSASKAAAYSITQSLRDVLAAQGTRVISVHPGPIATDMGREAGLEAIAEPPSLVADAIWDAMRIGKVHAYPDSMAKQIGTAYQFFAEHVVEAPPAEIPA